MLVEYWELMMNLLNLKLNSFIFEKIIKGIIYHIAFVSLQSYAKHYFNNFTTVRYW